MAEMALAALWGRSHERASHIVPPPDPRITDELEQIIVRRIDHDSRAVETGSTFACVRGGAFDGHDFAQAAVADGAVALLVDHTVEATVPQVRVANVREAMPWFASTLAGEPSTALRMIGLTGTNGKTTTTHVLQAIAQQAGLTSRVIGTLSGTRTTPESTELQPLLAAYRVEDVQLVAMEVSSHALDQHRADAIDFDVAVFTNLTPDHLDYHQTMEKYYQAKRRLFDGRSAVAVVNIDDPWGARLVDEITSGVTGSRAGRVVPYSLRDVSITGMAPDHSTFLWRGRSVRLPLAGAFNVSNALAAAEAAAAVDLDEAAIVAGLENVGHIPGRMEVVVAPSAELPCVLVDYSHTPDGITQVLRTCRDLLEPGGRLSIVFGAGGDRDRTKRPLMGEAATGADLVVVTSDNPRSEDPMEIIAQVLAGVPSSTGAEVLVNADRRAAIRLALAHANPGDIVVVAGKGHEATQTIKGVALPFLDRSVVLELIQELGAERDA